jgi:hypothetical protein
MAVRARHFPFQLFSWPGCQFPHRTRCSLRQPAPVFHPTHPACRAREALRQCLPELLRNPGFTACLKSDDTTRRWLAQLLINVGFPEAAAQLSNEMLQPTPLQGQ